MIQSVTHTIDNWGEWNRAWQMEFMDISKKFIEVRKGSCNLCQENINGQWQLWIFWSVDVLKVRCAEGMGCHRVV